jgi:hypothetical protein
MTTDESRGVRQACAKEHEDEHNFSNGQPACAHRFLIDPGVDGPGGAELAISTPESGPLRAKKPLFLPLSPYES